MSLILNIETSGRDCSVAIGREGTSIAERVAEKDHAHAERLTLLIEEVAGRANVALRDLDAVAVSGGPGSYTGLRIGVSTAKGLCYALEKPLIALNTLQVMAQRVIEEKQLLFDERSLKLRSSVLLCPMLDARRMEVFSALFNFQGELVRETRAEIFSEETFRDYLKNHILYYFGDGAGKCRQVLGTHPGAFFLDDILPLAKYMIPLAEQKFHEHSFEDVAYYEPFYMKAFIFGQF